jgi:hypothetical protein
MLHLRFPGTGLQIRQGLQNKCSVVFQLSYHVLLSVLAVPTASGSRQGANANKLSDPQLQRTAAVRKALQQQEQQQQHQPAQLGESSETQLHLPQHAAAKPALAGSLSAAILKHPPPSSKVMPSEPMQAAIPPGPAHAEALKAVQGDTALLRLPGSGSAAIPQQQQQPRSKAMPSEPNAMQAALPPRPAQRKRSKAAVLNAEQGNAAVLQQADLPAELPGSCGAAFPQRLPPSSTAMPSVSVQAALPPPAHSRGKRRKAEVPQAAQTGAVLLLQPNLPAQLPGSCSAAISQHLPPGSASLPTDAPKTVLMPVGVQGKCSTGAGRRAPHSDMGKRGAAHAQGAAVRSRALPAQHPDKHVEGQKAAHSNHVLPASIAVELPQMHAAAPSTGKYQRAAPGTQAAESEAAEEAAALTAWYNTVVQCGDTTQVEEACRAFTWFGSLRRLRQVACAKLDFYYMNDELVNGYLDLVKAAYASLNACFISSLAFQCGPDGKTKQARWSNRQLENHPDLKACKVVFVPLNESSPPHWRLGVVDVSRVKEDGMGHIYSLDPAQVSLSKVQVLLVRSAYISL